MCSGADLFSLSLQHYFIFTLDFGPTGMDEVWMTYGRSLHAIASLQACDPRHESRQLRKAGYSRLPVELFLGCTNCALIVYFASTHCAHCYGYSLPAPEWAVHFPVCLLLQDCRLVHALTTVYRLCIARYICQYQSSHK